MPELPEVETVVRGLRKQLLGRFIADLRLHRPDLRWPIPKQVHRLVGQRIDSVHRVAKIVVIKGEAGDGWLLHLGMSGRILIMAGKDFASPIQKHDHVEFWISEAENSPPHIRFVLNDSRRFGAFDYFADANNLHQHERVKNFGVDPTTQALTAVWLHEKMHAKATPIKSFLLNQKIIAGLGNIYVSEALFRAGIDPRRVVGTLRLMEVETLVIHIKATLDDAIKAGGSSLRDYVQSDGELGYFQHQWRVYNREGQPCLHCQGLIMRLLQQGRSTFMCEICQR